MRFCRQPNCGHKSDGGIEDITIAAVPDSIVAMEFFAPCRTDDHVHTTTTFDGTSDDMFGPAHCQSRQYCNSNRCTDPYHGDLVVKLSLAVKIALGRTVVDTADI